MTYRMAQVTMDCGHQNTYMVPAPKAGQASWCHRCEAFVPVTKCQIMEINGHETTVTYNKRVQLTTYLSNKPLNANHYF